MQPNVEIIEGDILTIELNTVFGLKPGMLHTGLALSPSRRAWSAICRITSRRTFCCGCWSITAIFRPLSSWVQKEVADRLAASAGSRDYGLLSATTQLYGRVEQLFTLPPSAFDPPPKVHSSVVRITIKPRLEALRVPEAELLRF